jgi:misacylated tRNA(Ala) deacylase
MHLFCHDNPETLTLTTEITDALPGRVTLAQSPFYPGGGGQLADHGSLKWNGGEAKITGFEVSGDKVWHLLDQTAEIGGAVEVSVEPGFRRKMRQLHTGTHILNAFVFQSFDGALVTGVQMAADGTARMDFDLPGADNDRLRALEGPINDAVRENIPVNFSYIGMSVAQAEHGLIRSRSVADARRDRANCRDPWPRSAGLRRHAFDGDGRFAAAQNSRDREQGATQSQSEAGSGGNRLISRTICWHMP